MESSEIRRPSLARTVGIVEGIKARGGGWWSEAKEGFEGGPEGGALGVEVFICRGDAGADEWWTR